LGLPFSARDIELLADYLAALDYLATLRELDKRAVWSHFSPQPVSTAPIPHFHDEENPTFMVTFSGKDR
jgi:hypothetical protein